MVPAGVPPLVRRPLRGRRGCRGLACPSTSRNTPDGSSLVEPQFPTAASAVPVPMPSYSGTMMDPELDYLEWHDAHLERIARNGEETRLEFTDVPIYRRISAGVWDAEIGPLVLLLSGAQVECNPPGDERTEDSGWVIDCTRS
jgi:hypothetical protein